MSYEAQLRYKRNVVIDQLRRIGGLEVENMTRPILASPLQWRYEYDVLLSPTADGRFGFWNGEAVVAPGEQLPTLMPIVEALVHDFDFELPGLRQMLLRAGSDDNLLVALEIDEVEPPELEADFPVSVALVLPDGTAANLLGYNTIYREVNGRSLRISAGSAFHGNLSMVPALIQTVGEYADQAGRIAELYAGVSTLTRVLSELGDEVHAIERSSDAVEDAAENLEDTENVALYNGWVEDVLPLLEVKADLIVLDPPAGGAGAEALATIIAQNPARIIYSGADIATLARDAKELTQAGYRPLSVTPLDMLPQTFHVHAVMLFEKTVE
jgi:23S rRNA (uracil1939-C5)-methyltransferase